MTETHLLQLDFTKGTAKILAELPIIMKEVTLDVLNNRADLMRDLAKVTVRVDKGKLRDTIRKERHGDTIKVRAGGYGVNYAAIIEAKYPYMLPSWLAVEEGIDDEIIQKVKERIRQ